MKIAVLLVGLLLISVLLAGCAAGANDLAGTVNRQGKVAGFWHGLWHGLIAPVTFVISLFSKTVEMYEVHNNGGSYNFGILLGMMIIFGGGSGGAVSRRSRRYLPRYFSGTKSGSFLSMKRTSRRAKRGTPFSSGIGAHSSPIRGRA